MNFLYFLSYLFFFNNLINQYQSFFLLKSSFHKIRRNLPVFHLLNNINNIDNINIDNINIDNLGTNPINENDFNPTDFINVLKKGNPNINDNMKNNDIETIDETLDKQIFRVYPYTNLDLPILKDCNNYFSGKIQKKIFWHQNSDQLFVYLPIDKHITVNDISAKFEAKTLSLNIKNNKDLFIEFFDRIIPDGSFYCFEYDKNGQKYIQLDLEKRFRMINWKDLFIQQDNNSDTNSDDDLKDQREKILQKLFAANKGMSKLTGNSPQSYEEMLNDEKLMDSINQDIDTNPKIVDYELDKMEQVDLAEFEKKLKDSNIGIVEVDNDQMFGVNQRSDDDDNRVASENIIDIESE